MDPQNSDPDCILCRNLEVCRDRVFNLHHRYLLKHAVVCRDLFPVLLFGYRFDRVSLVMTVFFSSAYSFCRDRVFSVATDISLSP